MKPELCLGTAQFGLAYGITNKYGQVSEASVGELLNECLDAGCLLYTSDAADE